MVVIEWNNMLSDNLVNLDDKAGERSPKTELYVVEE